MAPRIRNSIQIEVLPVPTEPEMRTVFPRGIPPFRMWSIASIPVTHRSRSPSACSFVGIDSGVQTGCALFEMNALSIRLENSGGKEAETASGVPLGEGESQPCTTLKAWSHRPICEPTRTQSG